jgi:uncharacterized protein (TIGR00106 family)
MRVVADISVVPLGVGVSLSPYIAECERVLLGAGLNPKLHAYGTNVEGEWGHVFEALRACHEAVHRMGAPRVSTNVRLGTRTDHPESIESRLNSVLELVGDVVSPKE